MSDIFLQVKNLSVEVEGKKILNNINLEIKKGETHVLMGPNGAGKSTLSNAIMGNPKYIITDGQIIVNGVDMTNESADKRGKAGLFMSFQSPIEVPGITLSSFIRSTLKMRGDKTSLWDYKKELNKAMEILQMDKSYADRDLNVGFSGGEKKKAEMLQLLMLKPSLAILDETDSGLDVDAVRTVSKSIEEYQKNQDGALLIITHSTRILESLNANYTHVMVNGHIEKEGDASLINEINENGFEQFIK